MRKVNRFRKGPRDQDKRVVAIKDEAIKANGPTKPGFLGSARCTAIQNHLIILNI